jgi:hypothetical protein
VAQSAREGQKGRAAERGRGPAGEGARLVVQHADDFVVCVADQAHGGEAAILAARREPHRQLVARQAELRAGKRRASALDQRPLTAFAAPAHAAGRPGGREDGLPARGGTVVFRNVYSLSTR